MWYLKACRSCLTTKGILEKIGPRVKSFFCLLTGLQLDEGDGFPQYICAECFIQIKKAVQFRRKSRRAHFVLKEIHAVKNQVAQSDVEKVDRKKTNLISSYTFWKPEEAAVFSYTTSDAIEPKLEENTPEIKAAITESLTESAFNIDCDVEAKTIKINIKPEFLKTESIDIDEDPQEIDVKPKKIDEPQKIEVEKLIKHEFKTLKSSSILVDIKPANWREIEKEEEEQRRKQREAEIEAALRDIKHIELDDDVADDSYIPEEIDLEDVFKGLKEESEKETESEPEIMEQVPQPKEKKKNKEKETPALLKKFSLRCPTTRRCLSKIVLDAFPDTKIRLMTLEEQKMVHHDRCNEERFKSFAFKCAICLTVHETATDLYKHVEYHNQKIKFPHMCAVCMDRFETEEELNHHGFMRHWYEYSCARCFQKHYSFTALIKCYDIGDIRSNYKVRPLRPKDIYASWKAWNKRREKHMYSCDYCNKYYQRHSSYKRHMTKHKQLMNDKNLPVCDICSAKVTTHRAMIEHMYKWHRYSYTCKKCKVKLWNRRDVNSHMCFKKNENTCKFCNIQVDLKWKIDLHKYKVHKVDCNMCTQTCSNPSMLLQHQLDVHGYIRLTTEPELNDINFYCGDCKIYFMDEKLLFKHLARCHHAAANSYENGCISCMILFDTKEQFQEHRSTCCTNTYPRKCSDCEEILDDAQAMAAHKERLNHGEQTAPAAHDMKLCETCGKVFSARTSYYKHVATHRKAAPARAAAEQIACRFCPATSAAATLHVSHMLFNHTDKPYCCTKCGQRFPTRSACRDHILKMHAPVRPYVCEACNRQFAHLDYLHDHCSKMHNVHLKSTDKSVYLSKRMFGKIYIYPDMKIDGSLIDINILERTPVEICDYMDENNKPIDYKEAFFFDPTVDTSQPTRLVAPPKKKRSLEAERKRQQRRRERKQLRKQAIKSETAVQYDAFGNIIESETGDIVAQSNVMEVNDIKQECDFDSSSQEKEVETEDVMGQLIEKDGRYYVLADGILYALEDSVVESFKAEQDAATDGALMLKIS